jgi:hypothetical protein
VLPCRECINRVCEAAGLKTADKKRKAEKRVQRAIGEHPIMEHAGANVNLTISSCGLVLTALESGRIIARHDMPRISFASGGDTVSASTKCFLNLGLCLCCVGNKVSPNVILWVFVISKDSTTHNIQVLIFSVLPQLCDLKLKKIEAGVTFVGRTLWTLLHMLQKICVSGGPAMCWSAEEGWHKM